MSVMVFIFSSGAGHGQDGASAPGGLERWRRIVECLSRTPRLRRVRALMRGRGVIRGNRRVRGARRDLRGSLAEFDLVDRYAALDGARPRYGKLAFPHPLGVLFAARRT